MLLQRLKEIDAIARLQEVSRTDEFKKSLLAAAKSPLNSARNIAGTRRRRFPTFQKES